MAIGEWRAVFAADVCIKVLFVCEDLAAIVVYSQCDGFADLAADSVVYRPLLKQTCGIRCQLKAGTYLES